MSEYKIQVNPTIGGILFNINGDDAAEVAKHFEELAALGPALLDSMSNIKQAVLASSVFETNTAKPAAAVVNAAPAEGLPTEVRCDHGPMKDLKGVTNAQGQAYKFRYYCAADRNDPTKCKAGKN